MIKNLHLLSILLLSTVLGAACGDDGSTPDGPTTDARPYDIPDPTDPAGFQAPTGEELAFGVEEGNIRNYFFRQGPVAVHLLTRSGTQPRIIAAFPAGNQGIGIWFNDVADPGAQVWVGAKEQVASGGGIAGIIRPDDAGGKPMHGIRATVESDAKSLTLDFTLLANVRSLRDFGYGYDFAMAPELTNQQADLTKQHNVVRVRRTQIGGDYHMEYLIKGLDGTQLFLNGGNVNLATTSADGGIKAEIYFLSNDEPLTPIEKSNLLKEPAAEESFELNALAFLTYAEKLQAGSWRFLTYFGRDTLLSVRMLMPALQPEVIEAALSSVLERINLQADLVDPNFDFTVELGDVSHEEELADYAAWKNAKEQQAEAGDAGVPDAMPGDEPADLRTPRYDYKMIDDDFLLAPVLAAYRDAYPDRFDAFLARTRALDGATYQAAIEQNLELVVSRARPYGAAQEKTNMVALKEGVPVGEWRDSTEGLGYGRYAFNVNVALVPAALEAAGALYTALGEAEKATEAQGLHTAWTGTDAHFLISVPEADAKTRVTSYADAVSLDNGVADEIQGDLEYYAISLNEQGNAVPIMHTDHGFVMLFTNPSDEYLRRISRSITRTFPAGLFSDVGVMVANPALAGDQEVTNPDSDEAVAVADIFTNSHYHGSVVWSWQQAMLAAGMRRQLAERDDLAPETVTALQAAECRLWETIDKANEVRSGELWTWEAVDGKPEYRFFGYNRNDVDESNAAQLWSTVYLAVKPPADFDTVCAPPALR